MRMYSDYFGISENAFTITPDPRYLFLSDRHREAMAHLMFGTEEGGGFVQITGEVGTGKTTVCRAFLEQLPESVDVALLLSPPESSRELLRAIASELQLRVPSHAMSTGELVALLNRRLLKSHAAGRRTVVIIDEAQNIHSDVLEQVRLLTNLETATHKLLQVFLIGQPELRDKLQDPALRQVAQRITARYHLEPLSLPEMEGYIRHRLAVAGCRQTLFNHTAIKQIHRHSQGIPRVINILCDRALIGAYANGADEVNAAIVRQATREWRDDRRGKRFFSVQRWSLAAVVVAVLLLTAAGFRAHDGASPAGEVVTLINKDKSSPADFPRRLEPDSMASAKNDKDVSESNIDPISARTLMSIPGLEKLPVVTSDRNTSISVTSLPTHRIVQMARKVALQALLSRWGVQADVTDSVALCNRAERFGLNCLNEAGGWDELRGYNRPALLALRSRNAAYLALVGMDSEYALVATTEGTIPVPLRELDPYWSGDFVMLWRPPLNGVSMIAPGANEKAVTWLCTALEHYDGLESSTTDFDRNLEQRLRSFQRSHGLSADGIAGPRTLIHLNNIQRKRQSPLLLTANRNE